MQYILHTIPARQCTSDVTRSQDMCLTDAASHEQSGKMQGCPYFYTRTLHQQQSFASSKLISLQLKEFLSEWITIVRGGAWLIDILIRRLRLIMSGPNNSWNRKSSVSHSLPWIIQSFTSLLCWLSFRELRWKILGRATWHCGFLVLFFFFFSFATPTPLSL